MTQDPTHTETSKPLSVRLGEVLHTAIKEAAAAAVPVAVEPEPLTAIPPAETAHEPAGSPEPEPAPPVTVAEPANVEVIAEPASSITEEDRARFLLKEPAMWNRAGKIRCFLAARHDAGAGCVTASLPAMRESGLVPEDAVLAGGDILLIQVKHVLLAWKVNRQNLASIATVCPVSLKMPQWRAEGGSEFIEYPAVVVGPVGYAKPLRMRRQPESAPAASVVVPQVEEVSAA